MKIKTHRNENIKYVNLQTVNLIILEDSCLANADSVNFHISFPLYIWNENILWKCYMW